MSEDETVRVPRDKPKMEFPSNSNKSKKQKESRKVEKVIEGKVIQRKQGFWSKFRESFTGDDAQSVGSYILYEILVPSLKNMISDMVSNGAERMLFGEVRRRPSSSSRGVRHTDYASRYSLRDRDTPERERRMSDRGRRNHDFGEIVLESRTEAEEVIENLGTLIEQFDHATVSDLYDLVGITPSFTDYKWGWYDMRGVHVQRIREGYLLDLPRPEPVE